MPRKQAIYKSWDKNELSNLYETHTAKELAQHYNVSVTTIRRALHYYGIYKHKKQKHNTIMSMSLYITYKGMVIDVMGSLIVGKNKYNTIENKALYMFSVLMNHIHGPGSKGLIAIMSQHEEESQAGYSETPTQQEERGFRWDRFIVNDKDHAQERNKNMIEKSKKGDTNDNV